MAEERSKRYSEKYKESAESFSNKIKESKERNNIALRMALDAKSASLRRQAKSKDRVKVMDVFPGNSPKGKPYQPPPEFNSSSSDDQKSPKVSKKSKTDCQLQNKLIFRFKYKKAY